ncbi:MAG TPA: pyridoxal phosphate-dependent aminotransferase [Candidatus Binatia bacterium]|nr:pyridoxal phosphate-dependent aminotransferase [Candidatus Binatia bacterium]
MFSQRTNWPLIRNRLTEALDQARARGGRILDLTVSNPTRIALQYDGARILSALASPQSLDYDPQPCGLASARAAVAEYYLSAHNAALDPDRIILTTSTSEGYSFVFRLLCNPGDELLVPKPSYPLFEFLADLQDVKLVPYPLLYDHGWQMDFHSLEKSITSRTRGVVVVHPNNPTGSFVKLHEQESLNRVCRRHDLALIVDEVFLDYPTDSIPRQTFAVNQHALTFTLSGISKISALPQMKAAWIVTSGPRDQVEAAESRLEVVADTFLSMNAPVQWALPSLLDQRKNIQKQLLARVRANMAELDRQLAGQKLCQRLEVEGGWYVVLRVPVTQSDEDLAVELLQQQSVFVHPGHFYDFPGEGFLVLALIAPEQEFAEGVRRVLNRIRVQP